MKLRLLALASAAIVIGTSASAADLGRRVAPVIAPAPAPVVFNWTGLYLGVNGGGGWGDEDCESCSSGANDFSISGPFVGAQVGFNWQFSSIVLGLEADAQWSGITGRCNGAGGSNDCNGPPQLTVQDLDWFGTIRGRIGLALGNWMPYITGGWAYGSGTRDSSVAGSDSANHSGWAAGAGVEWAINRNWSIKAEYQYLDFGSRNYVLPGPGPDPDVSMTAHTARIGVNFKLF
jgi:outer membrane immunogenic protein